MNQYLPYEKIIVKKMDELPLPDRHDAIWQAIQSQISPSLPESPNDDAGILQQAEVSTGKIITGLIITVIILAVTVFVTSRKKKSIQNQKAVPEIIQPQVRDNCSPLQGKQGKNSAVPFIKSDTGSAILPQISTDTPAISNPLLPVIIKPDSNLLIAPSIPPKDTIAKPPVTQSNKKNIGVPGISDSSYRISGKRDSL